MGSVRVRAEGKVAARDGRDADAKGAASASETAPGGAGTWGQGTDGNAGSVQGTGNDAKLSADQKREVEQLKQRDQQVRQHEQAHMAAGGDLAGGVSYTYQQGPDGRTYAVGGEVPIELSEVPDSPQATIAKAERVRAAALAPADPSGQDRAVAAKAMAIAAKARMEDAGGKQGETLGRRVDVKA